VSPKRKTSFPCDSNEEPRSVPTTRARVMVRLVVGVQRPFFASAV
jgi:hypothetical protein